MIDEDVTPSPEFEEWASEEGINNFHFYHCWAAWQAALTQKRTEIPANVIAALDRMCTPLDSSLLSGATADADAHSMRLIREYILSIGGRHETEVTNAVIQG
jgi:hypothetical protein